LLSLAATACRPSAPAGAAGGKLIVLGIDGMDPGFVEAHWRELPNLDRLRSQGGYRRLATSIPPQSPVAWSAVITGMDPGGHGIFDFIHRDPATLMPFSSMAETAGPGRTLTLGPFVVPLSTAEVRTLRKGQAFWQLLAAQHIPATVIRMPANFPPVPGKARSLAGMGTPDMRGTFGTFTYFTDDPAQKTRQVPGGRIVQVDLSGYRVVVPIEGPVNTFRRDRAPASALLTVHLDPSAPAALLELGETRIVLRQGEWSGWLRTDFTLIPWLRSASGMFRVCLRQVRPRFELYVSPVNIDPAAPELPLSTPPSLSRELAEAVGPFYTQGIAEDASAVRAGVLSRDEFLAQARLVMEESFRLFRRELSRFDGGLFFHYFSSVDQHAHILWGRYDSVLLEIYRAMDVAVGEALDKAGKDGTLLVLSDHGFSTFRRAVHLNAWLLREGFLALDDPQNAGEGEALAHVDWSRTQAYAIGLNGLYLNLAGRERAGIVPSGPESEAVLDRLSAGLRGFRDPVSGEPVVATVYDPRQVYRGASLEQAPDLIVGYRPGYRASWQTALGAVPRSLVDDNTEAWIGDHCIAAEFVPGVLFSNRQLRIQDPQLYDVTATILHQFGVPPPPGAIGRAFF